MLRPKWIREETLKRVLHCAYIAAEWCATAASAPLPSADTPAALSPDPRNPRNCRRYSLVYDYRTALTARHLRGAFWPATPSQLVFFPSSARKYLGRPIPFPTIICFIKVEPFILVRLSRIGVLQLCDAHLHVQDFFSNFIL